MAKEGKTLLSRDAFREGVFERDSHTCVLCDKEAVDAHHIIDRSLFPDGGYYLDNGASLCEEHHLDAERTSVLPDELYAKCSIDRGVLPPHLEADVSYDKWGNPILPNGTRMRGEKFGEPGVQKMLTEGGVLHLFTWLVKYPRTYHLPWSPGITKDDRIVEDLSGFEGKDVVVTVKQDGENSTLMRDVVHARSTEYQRHPSRDMLKAFHATIQYDIPEGMRICGENVYAMHSIHYRNLAHHFQGFSVWDDKNYCLSWDDTLEWFELLGITSVPVLYEGPFDENIVRNIYHETFNGDPCEGYVVRTREQFHYRNFRKCVAKFVRKDHVQTSRHWLFGQEMIKNEFKG